MSKVDKSNDEKLHGFAGVGVGVIGVAVTFTTNLQIAGVAI